MRNRRALSTVVGAVFFIIATTTVITYVTYSTNAIENFSNSVIVSQSQNVDRGSEEVKITSVRIDGGKFNMTVSNTGSLPVKLTHLWVSNQDLATPSDIRADLNIRIDPGKVQYNIGQSTSISATSTTSYNLKVVTERGNIATFQVSPKVSTRIQLITPGNIAPGEDFKVISLITNNSTTQSNIANLVPTLTHAGATQTLKNGPNPKSIATLPQGTTAAFTWTYTASQTTGTIIFNGSYTNAPKGSFVISNTTNQLSAEAAAATSSQWSQAASRVGILISGIPNPVEASASGGSAKWGIGVINPLDRAVDVYAISISTPGADYLGGTVIGYEPNDLNWRLQTSGNNIVLWEGGSSPRTIPAKSVAQFRVVSQGSSIGSAPTELLATIQALTSEGKLSVIYPISAKSTFSTMNVFYTTDPSSPGSNWGYLITNIKSGKTTQIFNATVENASTASPASSFNSIVKLIILIPSDFTNIASYGSNTGWGTATVSLNPDGSHVIAVQTLTSPFATGYKTYQFSATAPTISDTKLYVFQTTSVYVNWVLADAVQTASALSEAGVQVVP